MKVVTIKKKLYEIFYFEKELMSKEDRPFLIILSLKYKGQKYSFAVPFRSNIQVNLTTKGLYFSLPKRTTTKENHAHGLHYIKMFPIIKKFQDKLIVPTDAYNKILHAFIKKNTKKIVQGAQEYLKRYENGARFAFCTDIDKLLTALNNFQAIQQITETQKQVAATQND